MYNDENYKKRIFVLEIRSMITTMSYIAFLRHLSSLSFDLLSSSAIFFWHPIDSFFVAMKLILERSQQQKEEQLRLASKKQKVISNYLV